MATGLARLCDGRGRWNLRAAKAVTVNIGELEGQFDAQLSVGTSWSVRGTDPDLIAFNNGFKGVHDLELRYGDSGVFLRGKYWYDFELKDEPSASPSPQALASWQDDLSGAAPSWSVPAGGAIGGSTEPPLVA